MLIREVVLFFKWLSSCGIDTAQWILSGLPEPTRGTDSICRHGVTRPFSVCSHDSGEYYRRNIPVNIRKHVYSDLIYTDIQLNVVGLPPYLCGCVHMESLSTFSAFLRY